MFLELVHSTCSFDMLCHVEWLWALFLEHLFVRLDTKKQHVHGPVLCSVVHLFICTVIEVGSTFITLYLCSLLH